MPLTPALFRGPLYIYVYMFIRIHIHIHIHNVRYSYLPVYLYLCIFYIIQGWTKVGLQLFLWKIIQ